MGNIPSVDVQIQASSLAVDVDLGKASPSSSRLMVITWALRISSGVSEAVYKSVVQIDGEFLYIRVAG